MMLTYLLNLNNIYVGIIGLFMLIVALYLPKGGEITRFLNKIAFIYIFFLIFCILISNDNIMFYSEEFFYKFTMYLDNPVIIRSMNLKDWLEILNTNYNLNIGNFYSLLFVKLFYIYALVILGIFLYGISDRFFIANSYEIEFTLLLFFTLIGALLLFTVENLIEFVLAIEVVTLATYALTGFDRNNRFSTFAGVQYFILGSIPSGILVLGITLLYMILGSFDFSDITTLFIFPEIINSDKLNIFYNKQLTSIDYLPLNIYDNFPKIQGSNSLPVLCYLWFWIYPPVYLENLTLKEIIHAMYFFDYIQSQAGFDLTLFDTWFNSYGGDCLTSLIPYNTAVSYSEWSGNNCFLNVLEFITDHYFSNPQLFWDFKSNSTVEDQVVYFKQLFHGLFSKKSLNDDILLFLINKGKTDSITYFIHYYFEMDLKTIYSLQQTTLKDLSSNVWALWEIDEIFYTFDLSMADFHDSLWVVYEDPKSFSISEETLIQIMDNKNKSFTDIYTITYDYSNYPIYLLAIFLIFFNLLFKITAAPFNFWATTIYQKAPLASVTFLSIFSKAMVLFAIAKFIMTIFSSFYSFFTPFLLFISILTILFGMIGAFAEKGIKKFFVYSSMGHVGFMLLGLSLGTEEGLSSTFHYLPVYIFTSFIMWFILMYLGEEKNHITHFAILKRENPMMALIFSLIIFSMSGIPPLGGFFVKLDILISLLDSSLFYINYLILFFTVASFFYYLRIVKIIFFDNSIKNDTNIINKTSAIELKYNNINNLGLESKLFMIIILFIILLFYMIIVEKSLIDTQLECLKMVMYA